MNTQIDTADHVHHAPSGEDWVVAYVRGDRLAWCGWPSGEAALSDCTLTKKADAKARDELLATLSTTSGPRGTYARRRQAEQAEPEAARSAEQRCCYCDDTGDVHSIDGEWRGTCTCAAGAAIKAREALPLPKGDSVAYVTDSVGRRFEVRYMTSDQVRDYAAQQVAEERRRCAVVALNGCLVPPDGGSPTEAERRLCQEIARRICGAAP